MSKVILTPEQQAVVENRGGALLVSAAAGSGKTKVLLDRVLKRVEKDKCNLDDFLLITYTKAAAAELRGKLISRLSELLALDPDNRHLQKQMSRVYLAQISTVHSFCSVILREYAHTADIAADYRVCEEQEMAFYQNRAMTAVLEAAYESAAREPEMEAVLNFFNRGKQDDSPAEHIFKIYSDLQCYKDPKKRLEELRQSLDLSGVEDVGQTIWGRYLIDVFHEELKEYERSLKNGLAIIQSNEEFLPYAATFQQNLEMIERLKAAEGWEAIRAVPKDKGKLAPVNKCTQPELKLKLQNIRKRMFMKIDTAMEKFIVSSREALADLERNGIALRGLLTLTERYSQSYAAEKESRHVMDFNDLEHKTLKLLLHGDGTPTAAAREIGSRFVEIMVDEYQDTNVVQDTMFRALSDNGKNLFFVGDVKQSIYRFRLADPTIFLGKYKTFADYREAEEGQPRKILLSDNFRSHPEILAAANDVFRLTMTESVGGLRYGDAEALRPKREMPYMGSPAVELHCIDMSEVPDHPPVESVEVEAEFIARRIDQMLRGEEKIPDGDGLRPIRPEDIVILAKSVKNIAQTYTCALRRFGVRCVCENENIFTSHEIIILKALLQVIDNPHQDIPLLTVLMSPLFCVSADSLAQARAADRTTDLFDTISRQPGLEEFCTLLQELRELSGTATLRGLLDTLEEQLFLRAIFGAMEDGAQKLRNLDSFFALADSYENGTRFGLPGFLRYLDVLEEKGVKTDVPATVGAVRMMTIHKSKGLEFPVVFLAGLCNQFSRRSGRTPVVVDTKLGIGASCYDEKSRLVYPTVARYAIAHRIFAENDSEEMRVLYVAMTRPQYRLVMTCCGKRLRTTLQKIAEELTIPATDGLIGSGDSMGYWVLMTAMTRTEAGELFHASDTPEERRVSDYPWRITWNEGNNFLPEAKPLSLREERQETGELLIFEKPELHHSVAQRVPSKLTATQLKGRDLDEEISAETVQAPVLRFQKPRFDDRQGLNPAERGTAIHLAMQYLRYEACTDVESVKQELLRLEEERFLTTQQREAILPQKILRFFQSPLGQRVLKAGELVREFKFSILEDGAVLDPALKGEEILLQGVTDCAILEEEGLTIIDFKSDHVKPGEEPLRAQYYRGQLDAYSRALSKVFSRPVKERLLYFFATDFTVAV